MTDQNAQTEMFSGMTKVTLDQIPFIKFNEGETIEGIFKGIKNIPSNKGGEQTCWLITTEDGTYLLNERYNMETARLSGLIKPGQKFAVVHKGTQKSKKGFNFCVIDLYVA